MAAPGALQTLAIPGASVCAYTCISCGADLVITRRV